MANSNPIRARMAKRQRPRGTMEDLAEVIIAVASGSQLEVAAGRDALAGPLLHDVMKRIVT